VTPAPSYPGALAPERAWWLESLGVRLRVHEWGDPGAPPVVLCHGMFDHGRVFDVLAPLLAERFRVVAYDARGHGDSEWASAYSWPIDVISIVQLLRSLRRPAHLVGHSRGGAQATDAAARAPVDVRQLVNIDGFGPPPEGFDEFGERSTKPLPERFAEYLDWRRGASTRSTWRAYDGIEDLVDRRIRQNPRLTREWLRYFAYHGARETERGWIWKADPHLTRGFGPWQPGWIAPGWAPLRVPMLAVTGTERDTWGPLPEKLIQERLAYVPHAERARVAGAGHFVHLERPRETADVLLAWLER